MSATANVVNNIDIPTDTKTPMVRAAASSTKAFMFSSVDSLNLCVIRYYDLTHML